MVDQVCVDGILQVAPSIVREKDIHDLAPWVRLVFGAGDAMVDAGDDVGMRREECVGLDFFKSEGDGFLAKGASNFFQGVEGRGDGVLDEVDIGKAPLESVLINIKIVKTTATRQKW